MLGRERMMPVVALMLGRHILHLWWFPCVGGGLRGGHLHAWAVGTECVYEAATGREIRARAGHRRSKDISTRRTTPRVVRSWARGKRGAALKELRPPVTSPAAIGWGRSGCCHRSWRSKVVRGGVFTRDGWPARKQGTDFTCCHVLLLISGSLPYCVLKKRKPLLKEREKFDSD